MTRNSLIGSWIIEALAATGRIASPLQVAKHVWTHHEPELRSRGDLFYTWQLDLHTAAVALADDGALSIEKNGDWSLSDDTPLPAPARRTGREDEITVAVAGYLAMLQAEHNGEALNRDRVLADITDKTGRSGDQLESMLSNISHVVQEHGYLPLSRFRPRSNVPPGVRPAVAAALAG
ncbi:hypothetical protein [Nocardioides alcanivorans]|uniref:hypothetical protein n=1 Tax=Nocardioides alcanivorans TaxID=2897352 RepID=UPI001F425119|nr:hypothetical protein [Nocardioides alcanivorans]